MNKKQEFKELADKLVALGESQDEFDFWLKIFDDLEPEKQSELAVLMQKELTELEQIK